MVTGLLHYVLFLTEVHDVVQRPYSTEASSAGVIPHAAMSEMFNRYAIGVRAHADGVGVKQVILLSDTARRQLHRHRFVSCARTEVE